MSKYSREEIGEMNLDEIARKAKSIEEAQGMLKQYMGPLIEKMIEVEMEDHLGYEKYSKALNNSGNSRNGTYKKTILTSSGEEEIEVPRDRGGSFDPKILPKYETRTNDMEDKIINMYGLGLTTADIKKHIFDIYGDNISKEQVSKIFVYLV